LIHIKIIFQRHRISSALFLSASGIKCMAQDLEQGHCVGHGSLCNTACTGLSCHTHPPAMSASFWRSFLAWKALCWTERVFGTVLSCSFQS